MLNKIELIKERHLQIKQQILCIWSTVIQSQLIYIVFNPPFDPEVTPHLLSSSHRAITSPLEPDAGNWTRLSEDPDVTMRQRPLRFPSVARERRNLANDPFLRATSCCLCLFRPLDTLRYLTLLFTLRNNVRDFLLLIMTNKIGFIEGFW